MYSIQRTIEELEFCEQQIFRHTAREIELSKRNPKYQLKLRPIDVTYRLEFAKYHKERLAQLIFKQASVKGYN